jgi:hypothetical protein
MNAAGSYFLPWPTHGIHFDFCWPFLSRPFAHATVINQTLPLLLAGEVIKNLLEPVIGRSWPVQSLGPFVIADYNHH